MVNRTKIAALLEQRLPGHALPQGLYNDPDAFAFDLEAIYGRSWILIGFEAELPKAGSYLSVMVGRSPIIVTRDRSGAIQAFHNSCRHRGAQILPEGKGTTARLVCPYHRWTYELTGELVHAARMGEDFQPCDHALGKVNLEVCAGVIYVCLGEDPPSFDHFRSVIEPMLAPHRLSEARVAYEATLTEMGNWKLVMENARECYHCPAGHPELSRTFPTGVSANFDYGEDERRHADFNQRMDSFGLPVGPGEESWWQAIRFPLNEGCVSMTMDGGRCVSKLMVAAGEGDVGSLRWALEPHSFVHATGDFLFMFSAMPVAPDETVVTAKWLVHRDAVEGVDYDLERLTELWNVTNLQDRDLVENNQRGVNSLGYRPGPYSPEAELLTQRFTDWYVATAKAYLERLDGR